MTANPQREHSTEETRIMISHTGDIIGSVYERQRLVV